MFEENVSIIDLSAGGDVKQIFKTDETAEPVSCFTFHPSKNEVVVSTQKSSLMHVNTEGEMFRTFKAHQMPVLCMAYDPTGECACTFSYSHCADLQAISANM
jgi:WD40 repeat protein